MPKPLCVCCKSQAFVEKHDAAKLTTINLEPVAILFKSKASPTVATFKSWLAWGFSSFESTEKSFKRFVQVLYYILKNMTMYLAGIGIGDFKLFNFPKLFDFRNGFLFFLISFFAFCQTSVVPISTSSKHFFEAFYLGFCWIQLIDKSFHHSPFWRTRLANLRRQLQRPYAAMYFLMISLLTLPAVETKSERVHRLGSFNSSENSFLK